MRVICIDGDWTDFDEGTPCDGPGAGKVYEVSRQTYVDGVEMIAIDGWAGELWELCAFRPQSEMEIPESGRLR